METATVILEVISKIVVGVFSFLIIIKIHDMRIENSLAIRNIKRDTYMFFKGNEAELVTFLAFCKNCNKIEEYKGTPYYHYLFDQYFSGKLLFDKTDAKNQIIAFISIIVSVSALFLNSSSYISKWATIIIAGIIISACIFYAIDYKKDVMRLGSIYKEQYQGIVALFEQYKKEQEK